MAALAGFCISRAPVHRVPSDRGPASRLPSHRPNAPSPGAGHGGSAALSTDLLSETIRASANLDGTPSLARRSSTARQLGLDPGIGRLCASAGTTGRSQLSRAQPWPSSSAAAWSPGSHYDVERYRRASASRRAKRRTADSCPSRTRSSLGWHPRTPHRRVSRHRSRSLPAPDRVPCSGANRPRLGHWIDLSHTIRVLSVPLCQPT
jgi:hypothetical protein